MRHSGRKNTHVANVGFGKPVNMPPTIVKLAASEEASSSSSTPIVSSPRLLPSQRTLRACGGVEVGACQPDTAVLQLLHTASGKMLGKTRYGPRDSSTHVCSADLRGEGSARQGGGVEADQHRDHAFKARHCPGVHVATAPELIHPDSALPSRGQ